MHHRVSVMAPAKVNLHLQVLGARGDGYHELLSLFQAVSLADMIILRRTGTAGSFRLRGEFGFPDNENLVTRALEMFRAETGLRGGVEAEVQKRIPVGSGLGGGSSDAAATLRGLEALFDLRLPPLRLRALGEALGSDVPFFLEAAAALVEGRGERIRAVRPRTDFALVALFPRATVSTAEAFRWIDQDRPPGPAGEAASREELLRAYRHDPVDSWRFVNDFDQVVFDRRPSLRGLRERLVRAGATAARLTGSGSAIIGVFREAGAALTCALSEGGAAAMGAANQEGCSGAGVRAEVLFPLASLPCICYNRSMRIRHREATHGDYGYSHQEGRI